MVDLDQLQNKLDACGPLYPGQFPTWYKSHRELALAAVEALPAMLAELRAARDLHAAVLTHNWAPTLFSKGIFAASWIYSRVTEE
jgi:hypothetical protein